MEGPAKFRSILVGFRYWLLAFIFMATTTFLISCGGGGEDSKTTTQTTTVEEEVSGVSLIIDNPDSLRVGGFTTTVWAEVFNLANEHVLDGTAVDFTVSPTGIIAATAYTKNGVATATLKSQNSAAGYVLEADVANFTQGAFGQFVAGPADESNTTLTATPNSIPADGTSTSLIVLAAYDAYGNPIADNTTVNFSVSPNGGTISAATTTSNGIATATLTSSTNEGSITTVYANVVDESDISVTTQVGLGTVVGGGEGTGTATDIELSITPTEIKVKNSGGIETTVITARAWDETGAPIDDSDCNPPNNIRFAILNGPGGGEKLDGAGLVVDKYTVGGAASATLTSGTVSGSVTIQVSVIRDGDCDNLKEAPAYATAISTQVSIGAGAPSNIILFGDNRVTPNVDGSTSQTYSALAQDLHGNPVENGTSISFGLVDNLSAAEPPYLGYISGGTLGATSTSTTFTDATATFVNDGLQDGNILIILDGQDEGGHEIDRVNNNTSLTLYSTMNATASELNYVAGSAELGVVCNSGLTGNLERNASCEETPAENIGGPGSINGVARTVLTWPPQAIFKPFNLFAESNGGDVGDTMSSFYPAEEQVTISVVINPPEVLSGDPVAPAIIVSSGLFEDGSGNKIQGEGMTFSTSNSFLATFDGASTDYDVTGGHGYASVGTLETAFCLRDRATVNIIASSGPFSGTGGLTILPTAPTALFSCSDNGDGKSATCVSSATTPPGIDITDYLWSCTLDESKFVGCDFGEPGSYNVTHTVKNTAPDGAGDFCADSLTLRINIAEP